MISLCMIVKDDKKAALKAIKNLRPTIEELIVVDTGSTDGTPEALEKAGCKVYNFPWCDDFSAARNFSLSKATGDWIFVLDSDEKLDPYGLSQIKKFSNGPKENCYVITQRHYVLNAYLTNYFLNDGRYAAQEIGYPGYYRSNVCRMFPNDPRIRFEGRIHEIVEPSLEKIGGYKLTDCDVVVHHYGNVEHTRREKKKAETYIRMLKIKSGEAPDWKVFYDIGLELMTADINKTEEAEEYFTKSLTYLETEAVLVNRGLMYIKLGKNALAKKDFTRALEICPASAISKHWLNELSKINV